MVDENTFINISNVQKDTVSDEKLKNLYFAYGSNMNLSQIGSRCSQPVAVGVARLADYRLSFYGHSKMWDGAMETVEPSRGDEVWGVMFSLSCPDWERLDDWQDARMNGAGMYFHCPGIVVSKDGQEHSVRFYRKDRQGVSQNPSQEYLEHIIRGASENGLPAIYIEALTNRTAHKASYTVPMRANANLVQFAGSSCSGCDT